VLPMGHWWYANIPAFIVTDLRARLQALPKVKLLGYYSDAYKLEFIAPKFNMYRRILADVLAEDLIRGRGWPVEQALQLAKLILIENPKRIFAGASPS
jgi:glucuronate isomerase